MAGKVSGPVPKRSSERIRRNADIVEIEKVQAIGLVEPPDLDFPDPHPMVVDFYESLKDSAQSKYYEPSDWQFARFICHYMNKQLKGAPSAQMLASINSALADLLVSEGSRRRVRLEIEREAATGQALDLVAAFKERYQNSRPA